MALGRAGAAPPPIAQLPPFSTALPCLALASPAGALTSDPQHELAPQSAGLHRARARLGAPRPRGQRPPAACPAPRLTRRPTTPAPRAGGVLDPILPAAARRRVPAPAAAVARQPGPQRPRARARPPLLPTPRRRGM
jgi:hypothetical protein